MAAGRDDPGDRGCGGVTHCPETPVRRDRRQRFSPTASFTTLGVHTMEVKMKVLFVPSELLMMFTVFFAPRATKNPHVVELLRKRHEEELLVFTCSPCSIQNV